MWFKKLTVPESNTTKQVGVIQLWEVRWTSHKKVYSFDQTLGVKQPEVEVFASEDEANHFKQALEAAYRLTRTNDGIKFITINKSKVV